MNIHNNKLQNYHLNIKSNDNMDQSSSLTSPSPSPLPLDQQMQAILTKIVHHPYLLSESLSKHIKIRIHAWIARLETIVSNNIWRKNRNNYVKLLYVMLECREIMEPFISMAPEEVPTLQKHQINCALLKLSTVMKQKERDKENKYHSARVDPTELWNSLDSQKHTTPITPNKHSTSICNQIPPLPPSCPILKPKTLNTIPQHSPITPSSKHQPLINSSILNHLQLLSPISHTNSQGKGGLHGRSGSNLSACTYSTIEKCRDMICVTEQQKHNQIQNGQNEEYEQHHDGQDQEEQCQNYQPLSAKTNSKVNNAKNQQFSSNKANKLNQINTHTNNKDKKLQYFKKNRHIQQQPIQIAKAQNNNNISTLNRQQLYIKIMNFLQKHEDDLSCDSEYSQVLTELKDYLNNTDTINVNGNQNENDGESSCTMNDQISRHFTNQLQYSPSVYARSHHNNNNTKNYKNYDKDDGTSGECYKKQQEDFVEDDLDEAPSYYNDNNNKDDDINDKSINSNNNDNKSYYLSKKYSDYSSIELDQGIPASRVKLLTQPKQQDSQRKKIMQNYKPSTKAQVQVQAPTQTQTQVQMSKTPNSKIKLVSASASASMCTSGMNSAVQSVKRGIAVQQVSKVKAREIDSVS